jgi:hypothetical protein
MNPFPRCENRPMGKENRTMPPTSQQPGNALSACQSDETEYA